MSRKGQWNWGGFWSISLMRRLIRELACLVWRKGNYLKGDCSQVRVIL